MTKPAARVRDPVAHPTPPVLTGGTGSPNVLIGELHAWRGISPEQLAQLVNAIKDAEIAINKAEAATKLATGTPEQGVAEANEEKVKLEQKNKLANMIAGFAAVADIHLCATPLPPPPHGPGVVISGSNKVLINGQPACRQGDSILEANILANIPPTDNKITIGLTTVLIGD